MGGGKPWSEPSLPLKTTIARAPPRNPNPQSHNPLPPNPKQSQWPDLLRRLQRGSQKAIVKGLPGASCDVPRRARHKLAHLPRSGFGGGLKVLVGGRFRMQCFQIPSGILHSPYRGGEGLIKNSESF